MNHKHSNSASKASFLMLTLLTRENFFEIVLVSNHHWILLNVMSAPDVLVLVHHKHIVIVLDNSNAQIVDAM
jgi:hypothetical protein